MSPAAYAYLIERLRAEGVNVESDRVRFFTSEMSAGRPWHPKTYGELRVALRIAIAKLDGSRLAAELLPVVGDVLEEDCAA